MVCVRVRVWVRTTMVCVRVRVCGRVYVVCSGGGSTGCSCCRIRTEGHALVAKPPSPPPTPCSSPRRYHAQFSLHSQLLASFPEDLLLLQALDLHPTLQTERWKKLVDLLPQARLRQWWVGQACLHLPAATGRGFERLRAAT